MSGLFHYIVGFALSDDDVIKFLVENYRPDLEEMTWKVRSQHDPSILRKLRREAAYHRRYERRGQHMQKGQRK